MEITRKQIPYASLTRDAVGALVLLMAGLAIGLTVNRFRDEPLPLIYQSKEVRMQEAVADLAPAATLAPVAGKHTMLPETMTLEEFQEYLKQKSGLVFDACPELFHRLGYIPGGSQPASGMTSRMSTRHINRSWSGAGLCLRLRLEAEDHSPPTLLASSHADGRRTDMIFRKDEVISRFIHFDHPSTARACS